jgi:hypothetical protein
MTPEPASSQPPMKKAWILVIVLAVVALGLHIFSLVRKPEPWPEAARGPFVMVGLILMAWSGLLPAASTGAKRVLLGLAYVCVGTGLVLIVLHFRRP